MFSCRVRQSLFRQQYDVPIGLIRSVTVMGISSCTAPLGIPRGNGLPRGNVIFTDCRVSTRSAVGPPCGGRPESPRPS